jgi:hypothetical protein
MKLSVQIIHSHMQVWTTDFYKGSKAVSTEKRQPFQQMVLELLDENMNEYERWPNLITDAKITLKWIIDLN